MFLVWFGLYQDLYFGCDICNATCYLSGLCKFEFLNIKYRYYTAQYRECS